MPRLASAACFTVFYWISARMTDPKAALRDWSCKPEPPSNSGSILTLCLICFCPSNGPYVGGFALIKAYAPIARRGSFCHPAFCQRCGQPFAYAIGDQLCGSCFAKAPPLPKIQSCLLCGDRSRQLILKKMVTRFISAPYLPAFYKRLSPP